MAMTKDEAILLTLKTRWQNIRAQADNAVEHSMVQRCTRYARTAGYAPGTIDFYGAAIAYYLDSLPI